MSHRIVLTVLYNPVYISLQPKMDTRKHHYCPFKECKRAVKKLSQHLHYKHPHIGAKERKILCAKAKVAQGKGALKPVGASPRQKKLTCWTPTQPTLLSGDKSGEEEEGQQGREDEADDEKAVAMTECGLSDMDSPSPSPSPEESIGEVVEVGEEESDEGDLMDMTDTLDHPFLIELRQHLTSRHGKGRSEREARQISIEVAKYLKFSGPIPNPQDLYNASKLDQYLKYLEKQGKKPSTQHAILCRVKQGLAFVYLSLDPTETLHAEKCLKLICNWMSTLGKEARRAKRVHLEDMADKGAASMTAIEEFCRSQEMCKALSSAVEKAKKGESVPPAELRRIIIWLAGSLLHCNAQRPGAITNATLSEYKAATVYTIGRETYCTFMVANHKTATTGRAKITADKHLSGLLAKYVQHIHPHFEGSSSAILFPNRDGRPLDHLSRHVEKLANKLGICLPHTATETRHAAATAIAEGTDKERTAVAAAMSHSQRTQQLYYSLKKGRKEAVEGYRVMEGIRRGAEGMEAGGARKGFSVEETDVIRLFFADHISNSKAPSSAECRQFLAQHPLARDAKQVRDKVRNLIGRAGK